MIVLTNLSSGERMLLNPRFIVGVFTRNGNPTPGGIFRVQANDSVPLTLDGGSTSITTVMIAGINFEVRECFEDVEAMVATDTRIAGTETGNARTTLIKEGNVESTRLLD